MSNEIDQATSRRKFLQFLAASSVLTYGDARALAGTYRLASLSPVDMFPHTRHLECVALFDAR